MTTIRPTKPLLSIADAKHIASLNIGKKKRAEPDTYLFGMPVRISTTMPSDEIHFEMNGKVVGAIVNIGKKKGGKS